MMGSLNGNLRVGKVNDTFIVVLNRFEALMHLEVCLFVCVQKKYHTVSFTATFSSASLRRDKESCERSAAMCPIFKEINILLPSFLLRGLLFLKLSRILLTIIIASSFLHCMRTIPILFSSIRPARSESHLIELFTVFPINFKADSLSSPESSPLDSLFISFIGFMKS